MNAKGLVSFADMKDLCGWSFLYGALFDFGWNETFGMDHEFGEMSYNILIKIGEWENLTCRN